MKSKDRTDSRTALLVLAGAMAVGVASVVVHAGYAGHKEGFLAIASVGVLLAGSSALVGGTLGFLFGIPRTLQQDGGTSTADGSPAGIETGAQARRIDYRVNTNLEQISDWLTKILVGVGLTQISEIRDGLVSLTTFVAQGLGPPDQGRVFASVLLSYFTVLGFLFGYLWTRLFLAGALRVADEAAIGLLVTKVQKATEKVETAERHLEELKTQSGLDAAALTLATRQLNPSLDLPQVTQEELDAAVAAASRPIKVQIFNQAWQVRAENWREAGNKSKMERAIPVFRALLNSDPDNTDHTLHGQLGFALKDKIQPQWDEAERELTTAIAVRGPWIQHGWLFYEFNRAFCRIMSDPAFLQDHPSSADRKSQILEDLRAAAHAEDMTRILGSDATILKWMSINNVTRKQLDKG